MGDWIEITTQRDLRYVFIPETSGAVQIEVKASSDAQIALTNGPLESDPMTELTIGGWGNTKSIIKRDRSDPVRATATTEGILNANEYVCIWIRWYNSEVSAGLKGSAPFITYVDPDLHPVNYIAVRTGVSIGYWKIKVPPSIFRTLPVKPIKGGELRWVQKTRTEQLPPDAFIGGYENGEVLYVARAMHSGTRSLLPGKYVPTLQCAVVGTHMETHVKETCEILCGYNAAWVKTSHDFIPPNVFPGGFATESNGEILYIGRVRIDNDLIPGKVHVSHKQSYIPYKGKEACVRENYEILVLPEKLPDAVVWRPQIQENGQNPRRRRRDIDEFYQHYRTQHRELHRQRILLHQQQGVQQL